MQGVAAGHEGRDQGNAKRAAQLPHHARKRGPLANLLARDAMFTQSLRSDCVRLGLPFLKVDLGETEDALLARVEAVLGLAGPPDRFVTDG